MFNNYDYRNNGNPFKNQSLTGDNRYFFYPNHNESRYGNLSNSQITEVDENYDFLDHLRPTSITVIVWLHIIGMILSLLFLLLAHKHLPPLPGWFWLAALVDYGVLLVSLNGLWNMKKFGAKAFIFQVILTSFIELLLGNPGAAFSVSIGTVIMTAIIFRYYNNME